ERDSLVARKHRLAEADLAVTISDRSRYVRHLVAAWLALAHGTTQTLECFEEERLDIMRLETSRLCPFHGFADALNAGRVHRVTHQCALFEKLLELFAIDCRLDHAIQPLSHLRLLPVTNRLNQQFAKRLTAELHGAENVENLPAKSS